MDVCARVHVCHCVRTFVCLHARVCHGPGEAPWLRRLSRRCGGYGWPRGIALEARLRKKKTRQRVRDRVIFVRV